MSLFSKDSSDNRRHIFCWTKRLEFAFEVRFRWNPNRDDSAMDRFPSYEMACYNERAAPGAQTVRWRVVPAGELCDCVARSPTEFVSDGFGDMGSGRN
jgi:hypothetical protein